VKTADRSRRPPRPAPHHTAPLVRGLPPVVPDGRPSGSGASPRFRPVAVVRSAVGARRPFRAARSLRSLRCRAVDASRWLPSGGRTGRAVGGRRSLCQTSGRSDGPVVVQSNSVTRESLKNPIETPLRACSFINSVACRTSRLPGPIRSQPVPVQRVWHVLLALRDVSRQGHLYFRAVRVQLQNSANPLASIAFRSVQACSPPFRGFALPCPDGPALRRHDHHRDHRQVNSVGRRVGRQSCASHRHRSRVALLCWERL
jgi:hypothetical protein